ncbi:MAG: M6 family metalloprotease domain-containing protein [Paludibacteraceae bacterium]|nr:M6 family metalloprotease domain-containing protein [Paludibacteraceae bacterium]
MRKLLLSFVAVVLSVHIFGCPADPSPFVYTQPDGSKLTLHYVGDEYLSWLETSDNEVVVKNANGFFEYATVINGEIASSGILVGSTPARRVVRSTNSNVRGTRQIIDKERLDSLLMSKHDSIVEAINAEENDESLQSMKKAPAKAQAAQKLPLSMRKDNRVLVILVDFPHMKFLKKASDYEAMWNQHGYSYTGNSLYVRSDIVPSSGSVRDFYQRNSYGKMDVTATVVGPFTAKHDISYYGTSDGPLPAHAPYYEFAKYSNVKELVIEAVKAARDKAGIKFKDFDVDGDTYVDCVHIVFAGTGREYSHAGGTIWSHHGKILSAVVQGGRSTKDYIITPEIAGAYPNLELRDGYSEYSYGIDKYMYRVAPIGTVCHEYGHVLGAPDFSTPYEEMPNTGKYDVMAEGMFNYYGRCPARHNPLTKMMFGWYVPTRVINPAQENKLYTLKPVDETADIYLAAPINTEVDYVMLVENGSRYNNDKDYHMCDHGLFIYKISKELFDAVQKNGAKTLVNNSYSPKNTCYLVKAGFPTNDNVFLSSKTTPSSWEGNPIGDICFVQNVGDNTQFVVAPQIEGPNTIGLGEATYKISNVPSVAQVQWTITYSTTPSMANRLRFVNGETGPEIQLERGLSAISIKQRIANDINSFGTKDVAATQNTQATLTATVTSGGYSYVIKKTITINPTAGMREPVVVRAPQQDSQEEENIVEQLDEVGAYRLVYENPVVAGSANICVKKLQGGEYVPYQGRYTLSLLNDKIMWTMQCDDAQPNCIVDCTNIPLGVYHLVLQVNGQVVATSKMLKLY